MAGIGTFTIPSPQFSGSMGLLSEFIVPMVTFEGRMGVSGEFHVPKVQFVGTGLRTGFTAEFNIPKQNFVGAISSKIPMNGIFNVPKPVFSGGRFTIPMWGTFNVPMPTFTNIPPGILIGAFNVPSPAYAGYGKAIPISKIYRGIVMNVVNQAISTYSNFPFDDIVYFNGEYLGANSEGIWRIGADRDNGRAILSKLKSGAMNFGDGQLKYVRNVWLTYRTDGHLELTWYVDEDSDLVSTSQTEMVHDGMAEERLKCGRGLKGRFYTFELKNLSGADFDIEQLSILLDATRRRR